MTTDNWITLPSVIYRKIGDYCQAKDVLALASTCRTVKSQLNISVLRPSYELIYSQHFSASPLQPALSIPIFFPNHCHSVWVTCQWSDPGTPQESARIYIVARHKSSSLSEPVTKPIPTTEAAEAKATPPSERKSSSSPTTIPSKNNKNTTTQQRWIQDNQGNRAMIVWESKPRPPWIHIHELVMDATWNHDPTLDYFLWYSCPIYLLMEHFQIQALLVWEDDPPGTRYRQATYSHCMALEALEQEELFSARVEPNDAFGCTPDYQAQVHTMVAQLFTATVDTLSQALLSDPAFTNATTTTATTTTLPPTPASSTVIPTVFQSIASNHDIDNLHKLLKPLKTLANIYEQLVEQKEPQHCTIFPSCSQSHQHPDSNHNNDNTKNDNKDCQDANHGRRRNCRLVVLPWIPLKTEFGWVPQEYLKEIPRFVARIPLAPHTQKLHLQAQRRGTHYPYRSQGSCTFFLFAQLLTTDHTASTSATCATNSTLLSPDRHDASSSSLSTMTQTSNTATTTTSATNLWKMGDTIYCRRHLFIMSETATELDISISLDDQEHAQAYYLYVVPDKTTMEEFSGLQVQLQILEFNDEDNNYNYYNNEEEYVDNVDDEGFVNYSLNQVMELFLGPLRAHESSMSSLSSLEQGISFPLQLLKATALTLLLDFATITNHDNHIENNNTNHHQGANLALVSFLKHHGLSTTPSGLACIVDLIDAIAQQKQSSFGHDTNHDHHHPHHEDDPMIRTFRAM